MRVVNLSLVLMCLLFACSPSGLPVRGLAADYTFENGKGNDASGNGNDGRVNRADETQDRFGRRDEALEFESERDYVEVVNPGFLRQTKGSMVTWVKFNDLNEVQYIASAGDVNSVESYLAFVRLDPITRTLGVYSRQNEKADWVQGSTVISPELYYSLIVMGDGHKWTLYINGQKENLKVRQGSNSGKWIGHFYGIDNFVIGSSRIKPPHDIPVFSGVIDGVRLYDRPLKKKEIRVIHRSLFDKSPPR